MAAVTSEHTGAGGGIASSRGRAGLGWVGWPELVSAICKATYTPGDYYSDTWTRPEGELQGHVVGEERYPKSGAVPCLLEPK